MPNAPQTISPDPLARLIQKNQFVGWLGAADFTRALVLTSDVWKAQARGVPHNCFLLAAAAEEILLLRVTGSAETPADAELQSKLEKLKSRAPASGGGLTVEEFQFGLLRCRVLGTFYLQDGRLRLGSDVENYAQAAGLAVYRPDGAALEAIVNYLSPARIAAAEEEARRLGLKGELPRFPIGTVRYASTERLHRGARAERTAFNLNAVDFLARRTAVFGMTRTGKSNTVKTLVSVVKHTSDDFKLKIGQIIYDLNGEYANANQQDKGSLAEVFPGDTVRYRMMPTPGFELILNNFFQQIAEGHSTLRGLLEASKIPRAADMEAFLSMDFVPPNKEDCGSDYEFQRQTAMYQLKLAAYQAMLARAGYELPPDFKITFEVNPAVRNKVNPSVNPADGLTAPQAYEWFYLARQIQDELITGKGQAWIEPDTNVLINLLLQKNDQGGYIPGFRLLQPFKDYHAPNRRTDVCDEIYNHLVDGKIVILDLSVGDPVQRERLSRRIARHIFSQLDGDVQCRPASAACRDLCRGGAQSDWPARGAHGNLADDREGRREGSHRDCLCHAGSFEHPSEHSGEHGKHLGVTPEQSERDQRAGEVLRLRRFCGLAHPRAGRGFCAGEDAVESVCDPGADRQVRSGKGKKPRRRRRIWLSGRARAYGVGALLENVSVAAGELVTLPKLLLTMT